MTTQPELSLFRSTLTCDLSRTADPATPPIRRSGGAGKSRLSPGDGRRARFNGLNWEPYHSQSYTVPAGARCAFAVSGEPVLDEKRIATLSSYPDGSPKRQIITGDLRVRYTNLDTGATVEHDLNGTAFIDYGTDGSMSQRYIGAASVGFRSTDPYPVGIWKLDGYHEVYFASDGTREIWVDGGTEHNICTDLD